MLTVGRDALGTPEAVWLGAGLAALPEVAWGLPRRVVVLAPHPDDEVLAVGGALHALDADVRVVAITDGEASHPRSRTVTRAALAVRRADERDLALRRLGVRAEVIRLGQPDGGVRDAALVPRLIPLVRDADLCLAPWEHDGHPDHDATGRAAIAACASAGVALVRYPVWAWHWAEPDQLSLGQARKITLGPAAQRAKRAAIAAYQSQIAPLSAAPGDEAILPPAVLARFARPFEVVIV